jgi:hypothetical protein
MRDNGVAGSSRAKATSICGKMKQSNTGKNKNKLEVNIHFILRWECTLNIKVME